VDCGSDEDCFIKALKICKPASYASKTGNSSTITGLEGDVCVVNMVLNSQGMTCKLEKYNYGINNPKEDLLPYCTPSEEAGGLLTGFFNWIRRIIK
jgi:hypothetical protein